MDRMLACWTVALVEARRRRRRRGEEKGEEEQLI